VVIVEDDDDLRPEIADYLRRSHKVVIPCASLAEARAALEKAMAEGMHPKAVICDIGLPDGDGLDLFLAFAGRLPGSQWILMSGSHDLSRLADRLNGMQGVPPPTVVEKPLPLATLKSLVGDSSCDN
jgi:DNA-binding NtrC family response regulator